MPEYQDLLSELSKSGVKITAVDVLTKTIESSDNWTTTFVEMSLTGQRLGVRLTRPDKGPTDADLDHILSGYPFDLAQRRLVVQNVTSAG